MPNGNKQQPPKKQTKKANAKAKTAAAEAKRAAKAANRAALKNAEGKSPGAAISKELNDVAIEHAAERGKAYELAKALCVPNMFPSFGVQDGFASYPTGDSSPAMVQPGSFNATDGTETDTLGVPHSETWAFAYRDPRCSLQFYDGTVRDFVYAAFSDQGNQGNNWRSHDPIDVDYWVYNSGFEAYGPKLYTGVTETGAGAGSKWTIGHVRQSFTMTGLPASTPTTATISLLVGDEVVQYQRQNTTSAGGIGTWSFEDFVAVNDNADSLDTPFFHWGELTFDQDVSDGTLQLINSNTPCLRQYALADWQDVEDVIEKIRFPALNLMYSNTANQLYKNGFACAWQVPSNIDALWLMTQGFEYLANRPGSDRMEANEGIHIFWKSTDPLDWEYLEVGDADGGSSPSSYVIQANSDYLAISLTQPTAAGRVGYWTVFSDAQYRHDSMWLPMRYPDHNRRTFEMALEIQARVPQVHCNPFHIKDIFKWIGGNKGKLNSTMDMINQVTGNRAGQFITPAKQFLDIWFK
jgi:hypothetical protein